jgi:hypothetical protein
MIEKTKKTVTLLRTHCLREIQTKDKLMKLALANPTTAARKVGAAKRTRGVEALCDRVEAFKED